MRRVVVTGLGAITPLGVGVRPTWRRLIAGASGITSVANLEPQSKWRELTSTVAGLVPHAPVPPNGQSHSQEKGITTHTWKASDWLEPSEERRMSRFTQYSIAAAEMALRDAGFNQPLSLSEDDQNNTGVCLGSGIGNLEELYETSLGYEKDVRILTYLKFPKTPRNQSEEVVLTSEDWKPSES